MVACLMRYYVGLKIYVGGLCYLLTLCLRKFLDQTFHHLGIIRGRHECIVIIRPCYYYVSWCNHGLLSSRSRHFATSETDWPIFNQWPWIFLLRLVMVVDACDPQFYCCLDLEGSRLIQIFLFKLAGPTHSLKADSLFWTSFP